MQLKPSLLCRAILWLAVPLFLAQGCALSTPPPLAGEDLGTIGVVAVSVIPETDVPEATSAEARTAGAMKGLAVGLLGAALCPPAFIVGAMLHVDEFLVPCLLGIGTPVLMVAGAVGETDTWVPQEIEAEAKALLTDGLNQKQMQHLLKEQVIKATQSEISSIKPLVSLEEGATKLLDGQMDYSQLAGQGIETVLEVSLVSIGFAKAEPEDDKTKKDKVDESKEDGYEEMPFSLTMAARLRAIRVKDNEVLSDVTKNFTSVKYKWSEWVVKQDCSTIEHCVVEPGQVFGLVMEVGHRSLAYDIVKETFLGPDSPAGN